MKDYDEVFKGLRKPDDSPGEIVDPEPRSTRQFDTREKVLTASAVLRAEGLDPSSRSSQPLKPNEFLKPGELEGPTGPRSRSSRQFDTGATRDTDEGKYDYEGFLSPLVLRRFGQFMNKHRKQSDGKLRDSDNWQRGMSLKVYMSSLLRHVMTLWYVHRYGEGAQEPNEDNLEDTLSAILFNTQGYLHEVLLKRKNLQKARPGLSSRT
jgi:hypothetical protein